MKTEFLLPPATGTTGVASSFIFATEDGTISGWNPGSTGGLNNAVLKVDNSTQVYPNGSVGAVYKGLAIANNGGSDFLYATNFRSGNVDVFDNSFKPVPSPPPRSTIRRSPRLRPFGIQAINDNLYVTFALQDALKHDDVAGPGHGFVDVFSPAGFLLQRIGGTTTQPEFNSPWGLALAPANFGEFSGDLLVGNFGDSHVSASTRSAATSSASSPMPSVNPSRSMAGSWAAITRGCGGSPLAMAATAATSTRFTSPRGSTTRVTGCSAR